MITYATFHMELGADVEGAIRRQSRSTERYEPERCIPLMFASAERGDPGCRKVVLTDAKTSFPAGSPFEVIRVDADPKSLMPDRSAAWATLFERADGHVACVDSDLLIAESLEPVFSSRFDVGLTFRDWEGMPINIGVHFAHGDRLDSAARFHRRVRDLLVERYADRQLWEGSQYAASKLVSRADFSRRRPFLHRQNGFKVKLFPCGIYNFSAPPPMDGFYPGKVILHFKGPRKRSMFDYWERHLASTPRPPPRRSRSRWLAWLD